MILQELAALVLASGVTTPIRFSESPTNPAHVIVLQDYPGEGPSAVLGQEALDTERPRVQVMVRGTDESAVRLEAVTLSQTLRFSNRDLGGVTYLDCRPLQPPFFLREDANECVVYAFNLVLEKELS